MTMKIFYEYDAPGKGPDTVVSDLLSNPEFLNVTELKIGAWGEEWDEGCQKILDDIIGQAEKFSHIEKLFVGDMESEECEVSWIIQGDYSRMWAALPGLKELTIKGSTELVLGEICHQELESLTIICGGLPVSVLHAIQKAKLPNLRKLLLYIGVDNYGFDGSAEDVRALLAEADFPRLEYLGIVDSEIQDELAKVVMESKFMGQITTLDLSLGTLTDEGGQVLLDRLPQFPNIRYLDLHHHYLSDEMMKKLEELSMEVDLSEPNEPDEWNGEIWMNAFLTE